MWLRPGSVGTTLTIVSTSLGQVGPKQKSRNWRVGIKHNTYIDEASQQEKHACHRKHSCLRTTLIKAIRSGKEHS